MCSDPGVLRAGVGTGMISLDISCCDHLLSDVTHMFECFR